MKYLIISCILSLSLLTSCQNPCATTLCENGGVCVGGDCACKEGWLGSSCSREDIPSLIEIRELNIRNFPATLSRNEGWDPSDGPDLYFTIAIGDKIIYSSNEIYENASPSNSYPFSGIGLGLDAPDSRYQLILYDSDPGEEDDLIGQAEFIPYQSGEGFPKNISYSSAGIEFDLKVIYEFE